MKLKMIALCSKRDIYKKTRYIPILARNFMWKTFDSWYKQKKASYN